MDSRRECRKRIVLVSELFYPEESSTAHILTKIAGKLVRDFDVIILTGSPSYDGRSHQNPNKPPVEEGNIERVWTPALSKNNLLARLIRFFVLTVGLGLETLFRTKRTDIVFAVTNPAPLLVALAMIRVLRRFRLVFLVHDVFPENSVAAGIISRDHFLYPLVKRVFNWAYGSADNIITIGRDMSEVLARKTPASAHKITIIENWADYPLIEEIPRSQSMVASMGYSNKVVIQYAGNFGRAQGLIEFISLVSTVGNDVVQYVFRGYGALSAPLLDATKDRVNFCVEGSYPRSMQDQILAACDIALVILAPCMYGLGVPSKTYNVMAAGKPVLYLGPKNSEIYRVVKENNIGWAFDWCNKDGLISLLRSLSFEQIDSFAEMGGRARLLAKKRFSEENQLEKFSSFFKSL